MRLLEFWTECGGFTGGFDVAAEITRRLAPWYRSEFQSEVQFFIDQLAKIEQWENDRGISAGRYDVRNNK